MKFVAAYMQPIYFPGSRSSFYSFGLIVYLLANLAVLKYFGSPALLPPPDHDRCDNPSSIQIPSDGYATGLFYSDTIDLTDAGVEFGEYFTPGQVSAVIDKKTIWYIFELPTAREVRIELQQPGTAIGAGDAGFTTYYADNCLLGAEEIARAKLTPINKFGSTAHPCLDPGRYLVQVSASNEASGPVFLRLDLKYPSGSDSSPYDKPQNAYQFGVLDREEKEVVYDFACHSIEAPWEYECLPLAEPEKYTQSSWHVFTTGAFVDILSLIVKNRNSSYNALPDTIGYRLFSGDVSQNPVSTLSVLEECALLSIRDASRVREYICELQPNTAYSFQLIFAEDEAYENIVVKLCQRGGASAGAPTPILSRMQPANQLGLLTTDADNTTIQLTDYFSCNSRLDLPENQCGAVNPAGGVERQIGEATYTYDLATWAAFELSEFAGVSFTFNSPDNFSYARIFSKPPGEDCTLIDPEADLFAGFEHDLDVACMPPGQYSIQMLGGSKDFLAPDNFPQCDRGVLGRKVEIQIKVRKKPQSNRFSLITPGAVDSINGLQSLQDSLVYLSQADAFACRNTVIPEGGTCDTRRKAIYREFVIGDADGDMIPDSGLLLVKGLKTNHPTLSNPEHSDIHYRLYKNHLEELANAQNAHTDQDTLKGALNHLNDCITVGEDNRYYGYFCVLPGDYTLASLGDEAQVGAGDRPEFRFTVLKTKYHSRSLAEDLGNISNEAVVLSDTDVFSCLDNPDTLGGAPMCLNYTKLIYRQFYLDDYKIVYLSDLGNATGFMNLYRGRANDLSDSLIPWTGLNANNNTWSSCFLFQTTSECDPLPPGWYTIVTYGSGPGYANPSLRGNNGYQGDVGKTSQIRITFSNPEKANYNRPYKAYAANAGNPLSFNRTIYLGRENFTCIPDTPFVNHPIIACDPAYNRTAYYVFQIAEPAFLKISRISRRFITQLYPFDVRTDSSLMLSTAPVYPCANPEYNQRQICNLQPGFYTLVVFAGDQDAGNYVWPSLYIEPAGVSRFDHAARAYDFGIVPGDGVVYFGKPGDVHPVNSDLPPSRDSFFCSTGAQLTDPRTGLCSAYYNPLVYENAVNNPLYLNDRPAPTGNQQPTQRNLWYTFQLTGSGKAIISINQISGARPLMGLYQSDADGSLDFDELVANGGVDSTQTDGLRLLDYNRSSSCCGIFFCSKGRRQTITFERSGCKQDTTRYYLITTQWSANVNQQIDVSIQYTGGTPTPASNDHYSTAAGIYGGDQTRPPPSDSTLAEGVFLGTPSLLDCATRSGRDPLPSRNNCSYKHSIWYKFKTKGHGFIRIAYEVDGEADSRNSSGYMRLYREVIPGDSTSFIEIPLGSFHPSNPLNDTGHSWMEGCYESATYYLFWVECEDFNLITPYRPVIWLEKNRGDYCDDAIELNLNRPGLVEASARVDCHSMGDDFGEDGSNLGCLSGPDGYKSTWFKVNIAANKKMDVSFNMKETTNVSPNLIRYRVLYGDCLAMTDGPCNANARTTFSLNCLQNGDYYVQVISPERAEGEIVLQVNSKLSPDQNCPAIDPLAPVANFGYDADCESEAVFFFNWSTQGQNIEYLWLFPNGDTNSAFTPVYHLPSANFPQSFPVTLIVTNKLQGRADTASHTVFVSPAINVFEAEQILLCYGETLRLDATIPEAAYRWQDGSAEPSFEATEAGLHWVEVSAFDCRVRDSIWVEYESCRFTYSIDTAACSELIYQGVAYRRDTILADTFRLANGNDSISIAQIDVMDSYLTVVDTTICANESLNFYSHALNKDTLLCQNYLTAEGCDSVLCVNLRVLDTMAVSEYVLICPGEIYDFDGRLLSSDTTLCLTYTGVNDCDSTHCVTLGVLDTVFRAETYSICEGEIIDFDGRLLSSDTTLCLTYTGVNGCDSTHCVTLGVLDTALTAETYSICEGEIVDFDGYMLSTDTTLCLTYTGVNGCDSTHCVILGVLDTIFRAETYSICEGEIIDFDGHILSTDTTLCLTYTGANGCDSTYCVTLDVLDTALIAKTLSICEGETIDFDGHMLSTDTTLCLTYMGVNGCDSTHCLTLRPPIVLSSKIKVISDYNDYEISCPGEADGEAQIQVSGGVEPYSYLWSDGQFLSAAVNLRAGVYQATVTDATGCTATDFVQLTDPPAYSVNIEGTPPTCYAETDAALFVFVEGATGPYLYALNSAPFQTNPSFTQLKADVHTVAVQDVNGCEVTKDVLLTEPPELRLEIQPSEIEIQFQDSVRLEAITNATVIQGFHWEPADLIDCDDCLSITVRPTENTSYQLSIRDQKGCLATAEAQVSVRRNQIVYIPNAFSPNGDGINDFFMIYAAKNIVQVKRFMVFNRWGELLFERSDFLPGDDAFSWDGTFRNKPTPDGVYVYFTEVEFLTGEKKVFKGDVALIR